MDTSLRILVVDDRPDAADSLALLLGLTGYEVDVAYDGEACLAKAAAMPFDAVLLDIEMPGPDGYDVARRIRENSACKDSLIIAITGYGDEAHRRRSPEAGFNDYLVKPVDPVALFSRLRQLTRPS